MPRSVTWVKLSEADIDDMVNLVRITEAHDGAPYRSSVQEIADYFQPDFHRRIRGAVTPAGELVAFAVVRIPVSGRGSTVVRCSGAVHPQYRMDGLGTDIVTWFEKAGRKLVRNEAKLDVADLNVYVDDGQDDLADILVRHGFAVGRTYMQMRRPLEVDREEADLPRFFTLDPWSPAVDDHVRLAHNRLFADAAGEQQTSPSQWEANRFNFVPEWSFVVMDRTADRPRLAGFLLSSRYEEDWEAYGWKEGYTETIGVLPDYRGQSLATLMLNAAADAYQRDGMEYAGLDVDLMRDGRGGLEMIFDHLGYEAVREATVWVKSLEF